jgi:uncharacterized protein YqgC (DUF456 family)
LTPGTDREVLLALAIVVMIAALLVIPLGFPGIWIMIGILVIGTAFDEVAWWTLLFLVQVALAAEFVEWVIVKKTSARYGASNRAFWGAIAGGLIGVLIGLPIPVVGALIAGLVGTFVGAALVAWWETRRLKMAGRAAWGAVVGRAFAAAFKTAAGIVILVLGAAALIVR